VSSASSGIGRVETLDRTDVGEVLRLTLLAPAIVESILDGRQSEGMTLPRLLEGVAVEWTEQR
jgi:hypothetical protein